MQNNLLSNKFVKYTEVSLARLLADRKAIIIEDADDELVADAALDLKEIRAVLSLFDMARENEIEFTAKTTGIQLVEMVMGKSWADLVKAPGVTAPITNAAKSTSRKVQGWLNSGASWVVDKTNSK